MMKSKTQRSIRICSVIAFVLCVLWAVFNVFYFIGLLTGKGGVVEKVDWTVKGTVKLVFFSIYLLSTVMMIGLCLKIVYNVMKGAREQVVFPQNNVKPLFWLSLVCFVYVLCWVNQPILLRDYFVFGFEGVNFIIPFFLLFFAFMYKVAADAVEENNLTI